MAHNNNRRRLMTIGQAAEFLGIHRNTLRRWTNQGLIEPRARIGTRGDRRYVQADLEKFLGVEE